MTKYHYVNSYDNDGQWCGSKEIMRMYSKAISEQRELCVTVYNTHEGPTVENLQALLSMADMVNKSVIEELIELKAELVEMMSSAMKLSLPVDDADAD